MTTEFPSNLDDLSPGRGSAGQTLASPDHAQHHADEDDAIEALEMKVGINGSADPNSLDYKLKSSSSVDPGHKHTNASITLALADLTDTNISSPADGNGLVYDATSGKWKPAPTTVADASDTVIGVTKLSTAPASPTSPVAVGANNTTSGTPASSGNAVVDAVDVDAAATANKVARRNSNGNVTVPATPTSSTDAASKSYVDTGNSFVTGAITAIVTAAAGNNDTSITTTFTPRLIRLNFWLQGHTPITGSNKFTSIHGRAVFNATTLQFTVVEWSYASTIDNDTPAGNSAALGFDNGPDSAVAPSVGSTDPSNGGGITMTLSIASVSSTNFVIRCATTVQASNSNNARARVSYEAFA